MLESIIIYILAVPYPVWIIAGTGTLYLLHALILAMGRRRVQSEPAAHKKVSLIIPAKNEERDIWRVIHAIERLEYPKDKLEIIIIDHESTDDTREIIQGFFNNTNLNIRPVFLEGLFTAKTPCKAEALRAGVAEATGDVLVFVDAEVRFGRNWLKNIVGLTRSFDFCGGLIIVEGWKFFHRLQRMDWLFLCSVGAGFAGMGNPQSLFGKNMVITRKLYDASGGFPEGLVWTEDLELVKRCAGKGIIGFSLEKGCAVYTVPEDSITNFYRQKFRWLKGGVRVGFAGWLTLLTAFAMNCAVLYSMFLGTWFFLAAMAIKMLGDIFIIGKLIVRLGLKRDLILMPFFSFFTVLYQSALVILYPITRKPRWR